MTGSQHSDDGNSWSTRGGSPVRRADARRHGRRRHGHRRTCEDGPGLARRVTALEQDIAGFRSTYWRQHRTAHGPANELLLAYQGQHRLPARFAEILAEAADHSRLVQTQDGQQIAGALGVLTILGLPLGTALSILQVLGDDDPVHLLIGLGIAFASTAAALGTRYGRLVLGSLRGGPHGDD
ncbi:hypothetical protein [Streptomyces sp. 061-3]|uniref:hypothetical protein n=1 Tax=Streptomyces sp. 061-3 TaxID=2789268 RepID=UPI00397EE46F